MAVTLRLDLVDGASVDSTRDGGNQIIRVAYVSGLTAGVPASILDSAIKAPGMPQKNDPHPSDANLRVVRYNVRPAGPNDAYVLIFYEALNVGGVPIERLAVRDTTTFTQETIRRHPRSLEPLRVYQDRLGDGVNKILDASFGLPMRTVVLYGMFTDPRPQTWKLGVGCVNMKDFIGYDPGFWLCTYYDEQYSDADKKHRVTVSFSNKQIYDWSTWSQMRGPTGDFIDVDDQQFAIIAQQEYAYDTIWHTDGIGRWGFYPFCDFAKLYNAFADL